MGSSSKINKFSKLLKTRQNLNRSVGHHNNDYAKNVRRFDQYFKKILES